MAGHSRTALLLACTFTCAACGLDAGTDPIPVPTPIDQRPEVATSLTMLADSIYLQEGGETTVTAVVRNQRGFPMLAAPAIAYSTSSASVATVTVSGFVTAVGSGMAVISARATVGQVTLTDSTIVVVRASAVNDHVVLYAQTNGWEPSPAHVVAGGEVEWQGGLIATSGVPVQTVYLWNAATPSIVDEIDMLPGSAKRTLTVPGTYHYCSNACWDPPEWGIIVVH